MENLLLRSSSSWRGVPETYAPDLLGSTGADFAEAFTTLAEESRDGPDLFFEYFTGLLFNGDYSGLAGLTTLIDSWIMRVGEVPIGPVRLQVSINRNLSFTRFTLESGLSIYFPAVPGLLPSLTYMYATSRNLRGQAVDSPELVNVPVPLYRLHGTTEQLNAPVVGLNMSGDLHQSRLSVEVFWYDSPARVEVTGQGSERDGWYTLADHTFPMSFLMQAVAFDMVLQTYARETETLVSEEEEVTARFKQAVVVAAVQYAQGERAYSRPYPSMERTADADNGYVFKSYAEGKFGEQV